LPGPDLGLETGVREALRRLLNVRALYARNLNLLRS
jgi:hypothetical protein